MFSEARTRLTPKSIRSQLTLWYLVMLAMALAAFAAFVFAVRARSLYAEADAALIIQAHRIAEEVRPALLGLDIAGDLASDAHLSAEPVAVREPSGRLLFRSSAFGDLDSTSEEAVTRPAGTDDVVVDARDRSGAPLRIASILSERTGATPLAIQVAQSAGPLHDLLGQLAFALVVFFFVVLAAASYGGGFIARRALAPVDAIVDRVRAIQASDPQERLRLRTGSEELDRLVETLNGMLDRIEASTEGARRFAADASHELQTPIAAIRTAIEMCARDGRASPAFRTTASDLLGDVERLSALVRDLRLLALADAGHLLDRFAVVDLSALASDCGDIARAMAEPKGIRVDTAIEPDVAVYGSELNLRRVLLNLLENAVNYSPAGSTIRVSLEPLYTDARLSVADQGCGIGPDDLPHIFERFYRADPARARDTGGTGLGLAIADQIVRGHGGRIDVSSVVNDGSVFAVVLPLAVPGRAPSVPLD
jgi:two-component system, OmpR family, sensor kinase